MKKQIKHREREIPREYRIVIFLVTLLLLTFIWSQRGILHRFSKYGFLGIFIINFFSSATVFLPIPGIASVFLGGAIWNPLFVGLVSGVGAALGELTGYFLGYGGRGLLVSSRSKNSWLKSIENLFHRNGFITIFIFSAIPSPFFDFIGILSGTMNYPIWKFILATVFGRFLRDSLFAWGGAMILP